MSVNSIGGWNAQPDPSLQRPAPPPMENTAALLGMSTDDLTAAQQAGASLSAMAAQRGVSRDDLIAAVTSDVKANEPQGAQEPSDRPQQNLTSLADAVGMDPATLLESLNADGSLATLLGSTGVTGYGTSDASTLTSGLTFDQYA